MSAALAPVLQFPRPESIPKGSYEEISEHLTALFDTLELCKTDEARAECQNDIALYMEAEIRKVDGITGYLNSCKGHAISSNAEAAHQTKLAASWMRRYEGLKQYVIGILERQGRRKVQGRHSSMTLQPCPASVEITNEADIPACYKAVTLTVSGETWEWLAPLLPTVTPKFAVSKTAVKTAIVEEKIEVPGATLVTDKMTVVCR